MKNSELWVIVLIVFLTVFSFVLAVVWHNVAFKYMFQFITSLGFILVGFYYLLRARVSGNIGKGLLFIVLSPLVFYLSNLLFYPIRFSYYSNYSNGLSGNLWTNFLNIPLYKINPNVRVWHLIVGAGLFGNALVLSKKPKAGTIIAVNLLSLFFGFVVFIMFK